MADNTPRALTRRAFLASSGAAAAALYVPGSAIAKVLAPAGALSAADATTHQALYEAMAEVGYYGLHASDAEASTKRLGEALEGNQMYGEYVKEILSSVERGPKGNRAFSELDPKERIAFLREWAADYDRGDGETASDRKNFRSRGARNRTYATAAASIVVNPIYAPDDSGQRTEVVL